MDDRPRRELASLCDWLENSFHEGLVGLLRRGDWGDVPLSREELNGLEAGAYASGRELGRQVRGLSGSAEGPAPVRPAPAAPGEHRAVQAGGEGVWGERAPVDAALPAALAAAGPRVAPPPPPPIERAPPQQGAPLPEREPEPEVGALGGRALRRAEPEPAVAAEPATAPGPGPVPGPGPGPVPGPAGVLPLEGQDEAFVGTVALAGPTLSGCQRCGVVENGSRFYVQVPQGGDSPVECVIFHGPWIRVNVHPRLHRVPYPKGFSVWEEARAYLSGRVPPNIPCALVCA